MGQKRRGVERSRFGRRRAGLLSSLALAVLSLLLLRAPAGAAPPDDTRGLWVLHSTLTSRDRIDTLVRQAATSGFNTLFVQVRSRGDAFYAGSIEPRGAGITAGFDPLAHVLETAHRAGLRVHVWLNVNLVSSAVTLPRDRTHVVNAHPEWLMVPRDLGPSLAKIRPTDRQYVPRLAEWTRARVARVEGLYVSPITAEAARYLEGIVSDLAARYPIDGLHLDYVRYPGPQFDYSALALAAFRESLLPELAADVRARLDARRTREPLIYADHFPARWAQYRRTRLADLVARLRMAVRATRPSAWMSAAVIPDVVEAQRDRLQDWPDWARRGLIDAICPMGYTTSLTRFTEQIEGVGRAAGGQPVWAGIGAWRLEPAQVVRHIGAARTAGAAGIVLFSYDSLVADAVRRDALRTIGRAAFPAAPAATR
jgi:uncharacterized lipoprotein YddW (UPF0748 family)